MKNALLAIICLLSASTVFGQKVLNEGYIKMEITEVSSEDEQTEAMLQMMKGTQTEYFFNDEKSMVKANMMGGMVRMTSLVNNADEHMTFLMDAMGQKMLVESTKAERELQMDEQSEVLKDMKVVFDENDTKDIMGYKCVRATMSLPDQPEGMSFSMYVAKDIKASNKMIQGMQYVDFDGFPLEYIFDAVQMTMTITAVAIKDVLESNAFAINTSGYKKMTWKEFMDSMGQMGGMGF